MVDYITVRSSFLESTAGKWHGCQTTYTGVKHVCQTLGTWARPARMGRCGVFNIHQGTYHCGLEQYNDVIVLAKHVVGVRLSFSWDTFDIEKMVRVRIVCSGFLRSGAREWHKVGVGFSMFTKARITMDWSSIMM